MYPFWLSRGSDTRRNLGWMVPGSGTAEQGVDEPFRAQSECDKFSGVMKVVIGINSQSCRSALFDPLAT